MTSEQKRKRKSAPACDGLYPIYANHCVRP
jgi:hypothetical protein